MREIKFRGIVITSRPDKDHFIYGSLVIRQDKYFIDQDDGKGLYLVKKESVGQFIGLKDITGKEIYEKDIVELEAEAYEGLLWEVSYQQDTFTLLLINNELEELAERKAEYFINWWEVAKIVGNTCENPELSQRNTKENK